MQDIFFDEAKAAFSLCKRAAFGR